MPLSARNLRLWRKAIVHWTENLLAAYGGAAVRIGRRNCSFCGAYYPWGKSERDCRGCPIQEAGHYGCQGTPHEEVYKALTVKPFVRWKLIRAVGRQLRFIDSLRG